MITVHRVMGIAAVFWCSAAVAQDAERHHCRQVVDLSTMVTCNANLNLKLVCPRELRLPCMYVNIPSCEPPRKRTVCLTKEEHDAAMEYNAVPR